MPTSATPSAPTPKGDDRPLVPVDENYLAPSFEDRLMLGWQKYRTVVTVLLVAIALGIVAYGGWNYLVAQRELGVEAAYAAATSPAALNAFAAAHPNHPLAGVAELQLADDAYAGGKYTDAVAAYERAAVDLKSVPLASRARLGLAMSKLQGGRAADGVTALQAFASDAKEIKAYRADAAFHLVSHAATTGNTADVATYTDLLMQIDPSSPWTQHALQIRASLPTPATPAITLPGSAK